MNKNLSFKQDSYYQYDIKMLSQNRFDKLSRSSYRSMLETHLKYISSDLNYKESPFYKYIELIKEHLSQNLNQSETYGKFISSIQDLNMNHPSLVSQISNYSIL